MTLIGPPATVLHHLGPPTLLQSISFGKRKLDHVKTCLGKSQRTDYFLKDKFQNLYHDIQGLRKSCSISSFISSQSTCTPVTPRDHTFFNHATHFNKLLYLSLLVLMFGMPFHTSSARPKFLTIIIKHHCHFRSHRFLLCVPMVLCSSCHPTTDFT